MLVFLGVRQVFTVRSKKISVLQQKFVKIGSDIPVSHLNDTVLLHNIGIGRRGSFHYEGWDIFYMLRYVGEGGFDIFADSPFLVLAFVFKL